MRRKITEEDTRQVNKFADKISTDHYEKRGQGDADKRRIDQRVGKFGEIASYHFLKPRFPTIAEPDFNIYPVKKKSWAGDMPYDGGTIHSKSQLNTQANRYGASWVFERRDKEIFETYEPNDWVSFTTVNLESGYVDWSALVRVCDLHAHGLFAEMKIFQLRPFKVCVYLDDLREKKMVGDIG